MSTLQPSDARETAEIVAWAAAEGRSLEIVAGGTKRALGRPVKPEHVLDLSRLAGIVAYEPAELVLTAGPGEPLATIAAALAAKGQMLAFEPPDWRSLLGSSGEPTLGGAIACNLAGSRRVRAGSARDYLLGFSAVNGFGETWKAGGKVVKNVTGYDLAKLQAGAYGTLSALTEVTVKVTPKPETSCTLVLHGLADEVAIPMLAQALNSPFEVSGAAHLPAAAARRSRVGGVSVGLAAATLLRLEGPRPSVAYRADALEALLGRGARLDDWETEVFWAELGSVRPLLAPGARIVWRLCPTPSRAASLAQACLTALRSAEVVFDWGGGLVWLCLDEGEAGADGAASVVRPAMKSAGGHATLIAAPEAVRGSTPVFEPLESAVARLSARVKSGFDPRHILNPGRMQEGW
ncbi:FAD-binding protein [Roseiarcus sp.]|uniref:FAD-binding protein n=1 Tax=Roseiarcus sp. TaxID=1969460 RepID=UPI003F96BEDD